MRSAGIVRGVTAAFPIVVSIASFAGPQDTLTEPPTLTAPSDALLLLRIAQALRGELGCPACGS